MAVVKVQFMARVPSLRDDGDAGFLTNRIRNKIKRRMTGKSKKALTFRMGTNQCPIYRAMLAILAGIVIGGGVNMALIALSPPLIPPPAGVDVTSAESLSKAMHLFEPRHFIMPFLTHALGTVAGALAAYLIAATYSVQIALVIGAVFLSGGVAASFMIPAHPDRYSYQTRNNGARKKVA